MAVAARWVSIAIAATGLLAACASPAGRTRDLARHAHMETLDLQGTSFDHVAFFSGGRAGGRLAVFIEGDGSPWIEDGTRVAADPTPRNPLALRLALRTPGSVLYLGRPCYYGVTAPPCSSKLWTSARYSEDVVASLAAAVTRFMNSRAFDSVVLVGHSGGGTLATLMAPRIPHAREVITVGANLDTAAWSDLHGYLPLDESLNPADLPPLPPSILERHLVGGRDPRVPPATSVRYTRRLPEGSVVRFEDFDHVCCWERDWPAIWARVTQDIDREPLSSASVRDTQ